MSTPLVLGIETSCDETGVGLVSGGVLLGDALASSMEEHARFGGVVPEVAARAHLEAMAPMVRTALQRAEVDLADVTAVAVTAGPGLSPALQVGLAAGKAYALAAGVPLYAVHHLAGHAAVDVLDHGPLPERCVALIVSGGHTSLLSVGDLARDEIVHLGDTVDDAAGEAFDKVARLLGLPYPGGPAIDRAARDGDPRAIAFPRPLTGPSDPPWTFSFSGLKTAVARWVEAHDGHAARARRRGVVPGGGGGHPRPQGRRRLRRPGRRHPAHGRRGRGELPRALADGGAVRRRRASPCASRRSACAPTTAR